MPGSSSKVWRAHPTSLRVARVAPGFINLTMAPGFWQRQVPIVLAAGRDYGRSDIGRGCPINVEFCSANPNGPLHVGHGRGTVFGDALSSVLEHAGFAVTREFYINDAGAQTELLARSLHLRYREVLGDWSGDIPSGLYPGEYLRPSRPRSQAATGGAGWTPTSWNGCSRSCASALRRCST